MIVKLKQFGESLSTRQAGKDAYGGFLSTLSKLDTDEIIEIDFEGISSLSPSWADEFFSPLLAEYEDRLVLRNSNNLSVNATIDLLENIKGQKFKRKEIK